MSCTFIPPYLLRRLIAVSDDDHVCHSGQQTLAIDERLAAAGPASEPVVPADPAAGARAVHSAYHTEQLPGELVRGDGREPTGDPAADEIFGTAGAVVDQFSQIFGRTSIDGRGSAVTITVHYATHYDNAFWGRGQFAFGDGDGNVFNRFSAIPDVFAHLYGHAVTEFSAGLGSDGEPGALTESLADIFASVVEQREAAQPADQADWLIGAGIFRGTRARALRSLRDPGTAYDDPELGRDPQVGSMSDYVQTGDDRGGVHTNSGIPSRAFVLAALALGGNSWELAAPIWYAALTGGRVGTGCSFAEFAEACVAAAAERSPDRPEVSEQVRRAWVEVGVLGPDASPLAANPAWETGSNKADATPPDGGTHRVVVRRSGGIAGSTRRGELDLDTDRQAPEVRELLGRVDLSELPRQTTATPSRPQPDRFVYTLEYAGRQVTVGEQDLGGDLRQLVRIVLDHQD